MYWKEEQEENKMAKTRNYLEKYKHHLFCKYWFRDAELKFINSIVEYERYAEGRCAKQIPKI